MCTGEDKRGCGFVLPRFPGYNILDWALVLGKYVCLGCETRYIDYIF